MPFVDPDRIEQCDRVQAASFAPGTCSHPLLLVGIQGVPRGDPCRIRGLRHLVDVLTHDGVHAYQHPVTMLTDLPTNTKTADSVLIDIRKAFDTIDHTILLQKWNNYGMCGIIYQWSYLTRRKQYVQFRRMKSSLEGVQCGVLQGSILSHKLFNLCLNSTCNVLRAGCILRSKAALSTSSSSNPQRHQSLSH